MSIFDYELEIGVQLISGEKGQIIGRAEYSEGQPSYLVRYVAGDGRLTEAWWSANAIANSSSVKPTSK